MKMDKILITLKRAIEAGSDALKKTRSEGLMFRQKSYKEFVTNCDIASENAIVEVLKGEYPDSSIYSEEVGAVSGEEELLWVLDPIDGTHNFMHNIPFYAISIGAYHKEEAIAGMIYLPEFDACYYALRGKGAFLNDKRIRVSDRGKLSEAMVAYDNQFQKHKAMLKNLPLLQEKCFTLRIFGSATVDICKVSEGAIEARVFHKTKFVDFAAGAMIVKEAGGNITDFDGRRVTAETSDVIVSNGKIHKELVDLLVLD